MLLTLRRLLYRPADLLRRMRLRLADNRSLPSSGITWPGAGVSGSCTPKLVFPDGAVVAFHLRAAALPRTARANVAVQAQRKRAAKRSAKRCRLQPRVSPRSGPDEC